jgi:type VI secretion system secreted protein VgrG
LILDRTDDKLPAFYFSGVFASLELLHEFDGRVLVRGIIVPRIWQLSLSHHSRVFTKMSIPEIIEAVLGENVLSGDDYELRLGTYAKEEHVCQYRESDLAFLSRWMEREGIYYFFEHSDEGEKLIICDDKSYDKDVIGTPVRYHPQAGGDMSAGASFRSFRCRYATLPATVKLKDYDYAKPNLDVSGVASVSDGGTAEVSIYGDRFFAPSDGKRIAQLRAESYKAREVVYQALGTRLHIRPGYVFELEDHPRAPFNAEYVAIEVTHSGNQATGGGGFREFITMEHDDVYLVEVSAIPAKTQFRAERSTPWPRIYGYENGVIDGSAESEYAQIDDQGRYSVKFKFDESSLKNGKASTFVRMMQPHGGAVEGFHFPLRKGTEVVLSFLGGDPDRPVISGVVPNMLLPSPVTSSNHTRNVIQTGGRNRMEFEDLSGQQWIHLSTPHEKTYIRLGLPFDGVHEMHFQTEKDTLLESGQNFDLHVGQLAGNGNWDAIIKNHWRTHVQDGGVSIGVKLAPLAPAGGKYTIEALSDITSHTTTGNYVLNVDAGTSTTNIHGATTVTVAAGKYEHTVTGGATKLSNTDNTTTVESKGLVTVESKDAAMDIKAKAAIKMTSATDSVTISAPKGITLSTPSNTVTVDCTTFTDTSLTKKSNWGSVSDLAKGKWTVYKLGEWIEVGVSAKASLSLSASLAAKVSINMEFAKTIDLKEKFAKQEACMTMMVESPFIDITAAEIMITCAMMQATSALKTI